MLSNPHTFLAAQILGATNSTVLDTVVAYKEGLKTKVIAAAERVKASQL